MDPKPLIEVDGKTLIEQAVESLGLAGTYIFIVHQQHCDHFDLRSLLNRIAPDCRIVITDTVTQGPACSALLAEQYITHDELVIAKNPAFTLNDSEQRDLFSREYKKSSALYYEGQPDFDQLLDRIGKHLNSM